jgi:hypothetical protein
MWYAVVVIYSNATSASAAEEVIPQRRQHRLSAFLLLSTAPAHDGYRRRRPPRSAARGVGHPHPKWARHRGPFDFGYYLRQRYWFSRAYAGARADHLSPVRRIGYLVAAPVVPFLLLGRMSARVWRKRCRRSRYAAAIPLLLPALAVYVAGEWAGYAAGPGRALSKVE